MKLLKIFVIIVLVLVFSASKGQTNDLLLDQIDFNDTTLIAGDFMWQTIAKYITEAQNSTDDPKDQMYMMILATDNVLSRVMSYEMYRAVYQYLISGFSELGANMVVDYLVRMPYLEYLNPNQEQRAVISSIAEAYSRDKIGFKVPEIHSITTNNLEITLSEIKAQNTAVLFWSDTCPHCCDMIKELGRLAAERDDVAVVTVCVSKDLKKVKRLLRKAKLDSQYNICDGMGWDSPIVEDYAVDMTPSLFLLDENKVLKAKPFDIEELKENLQI